LRDFLLVSSSLCFSATLSLLEDLDVLGRFELLLLFDEELDLLSTEVFESDFLELCASALEVELCDEDGFENLLKVNLPLPCLLLLFFLAPESALVDGLSVS
jgi:hypothetical protein